MKITIDDDTIAGSATETVVVTVSDPSTVPIVVAIDAHVVDAALVPYTPADGTDWPNPDPVNVASALDALATGGIGGGGGGGAVAVKEAGTEITSAASAIDFGAGFDVTESPAGEANVSLDLSEVGVPAASLTGTIDDARIPSAIARDSEVTAAISAHEAAGDPHPGYLTAAEGNAAYSALGHNHAGTYDPAGTAAAAVAAHEALSDPHPTYLTAAEGNAAYATAGHNHTGVYDPAGTAIAAVAAHAAATDPHGDRAYSVARANHTGTQTMATISDAGPFATAAPGNWKTVHTNGSGAVASVALGSAGTVLTSNGTAAAPSWGAVPESNLGLVMSRALFR